MSKVLSFTIIFLLGAFLGWGTSQSYGTGAMSQTGQQIGVGGGPADEETTPRPDALSTRLLVNNLFREHGTLATLHMQALYDGKDTKPTSQLLETNAQQVASIIGSVYGDSARTDFLSMWKQHISLYEEYTKALKAKDTQEQKTVREKLAALSEDMGKMVHQMSPNFSQAMVTKLMREHVTLTLSIIDAYAANDQDEFITTIKTAADQASRFSQYIFDGMQDAKPQAFK